MIYTPLTKQAMRLCYAAHAGQQDKSGIPYVFHPIHLAEQMDDEYSVVVALLHDVVEDTAYTLKDLRQMGYPEQVIEAIRLMTHPESMPYMDYVAAIKENPIARKVKLADLRHNSDLTRLDHVDAKAITRAEKYKQAIALLTNFDLSGLLPDKSK